MRNKNFRGINNDFNVKQDLMKVPDRGYSQIEKFGIKKSTLDYFFDHIQYSSTRRIPVFVYRDFFGNENGYLYFSESFNMAYIEGDGPSLFYNTPTLSPKLVRTVFFCPSPIELLSFVQLKNIDCSISVVVCLHPDSPINELKRILDFFPYSNFVSIHGQDSPYDTLKYLSIDFTLQEIPHKIEISSGKVVFHIRRSQFSTSLDNINWEFLNDVRRHTKYLVKNRPPEKPYKSFNEIINGAKRTFTPIKA